MKGTFKIVVGVFGALSTVLIGAVFLETLIKQTISVQPISVTKSISEAGFTAEVASLRLGDGVNSLIIQAKTRSPHRNVSQPNETPDVAVPNIGISVHSLALWVDNVFGLKRHQSISGEFTIEGQSTFLTLRLDGVVYFRSSQANDGSAVPGLLEEGANATLRIIQPYTFAVLVHASDREQSQRIIEEITIKYPKESLEARYARNLRSNIILESSGPDAAMIEYREEIAFDPKNPFPHYEVGNLLKNKGLLEEAKAEYKVAIGLDNHDALAHYGLGITLRSLRRQREAIGEFKSAIALDPTFAAAFYALGNVLFDLGRQGDAMQYYQKSVVLDPKLAPAHYGLGLVLSRLGRINDAILEYKVALNVDPTFSLPHRGLGDIYRDRGMPDASMTEYDKAKMLESVSPAP